MFESKLLLRLFGLFRLPCLLIQVVFTTFYFSFYESSPYCDGAITFSNKYLQYWIFLILIEAFFATELLLKIHLSKKNVIETESTAAFLKEVKPPKVLRNWFKVALLIPFELIGYAVGYHWFARLGCIRLCRIVLLRHFWVANWRPLLHEIGIHSSPMHRTIGILLMWILLIHLFACGFYGIGMYLLNTGESNNWLTFDNLVILDDNGELYFVRQLQYIYLRALYWSVQILTTVGYGDILPHHSLEVWFLIIYLYVSLVAVVLAISNNALLFGNLDEVRANHQAKVSRLLKYAAYRRLPLQIVDRIKSYYEHQYHLMDGVDETEIMNELPKNIQNKIRQCAVVDLFKNVSDLKNVPRLVLNNIVDIVESFIYSPGDVIVAEGRQLNGLYVISSGTTCVHGANVALKLVLNRGDCFGNRSLYTRSTSHGHFSAITFTEVLYLPGSEYRKLCKKYLTNFEYNVMFAKAIQNATSVEHGVSEGGGSRSPSKTRVYMLQVASGKHHIQRGNISWTFGGLYQNIRSVTVFCCLLFFSFTSGLLIIGIASPHYWRNYRALIIISIMADIIMLLDVCPGRMFLYGFINDIGLEVLDRKLIFDKFKAESNYIVLFLSLFPIDIIFLCMSRYSLFGIFRLLKLLHCGQLPVVWTDVEHVIRSIGISPSLETTKYFSMMLLLCWLIHWPACFWVLACNSSTNWFGYATNWKHAAEVDTLLEIDFDWMWGSTQYFRALYWTLSTLTTMGYSDMLPTNEVEITVNIIIMLCGCFFLNAMVGAIASVIGQFSKDKLEYSAKVSEMKRVLDLTGMVPYDIEVKIMQYYAYIWDIYGGVDEKKVLADLSRPLREAVADFIIGPTIRKIPFFSFCNSKMQELIVGMLQSRVFLDGDNVLKYGEMGKEMFIIERGQVEVTSADRKTNYITLRNGDFIGESCLLRVVVRAASAFAIGYCDTYYLTKESFEECHELYPEEYDRVISEIQHIMDGHKKKNSLKMLSSSWENRRIRSRANSVESSLDLNGDAADQVDDTSGHSPRYSFAAAFPTIPEVENTDSNASPSTSLRKSRASNHKVSPVAITPPSGEASGPPPDQPIGQPAGEPNGSPSSPPPGQSSGGPNFVDESVLCEVLKEEEESKVEELLSTLLSESDDISKKEVGKSNDINSHTNVDSFSEEKDLMVGEGKEAKDTEGEQVDSSVTSERTVHNDDKMDERDEVDESISERNNNEEDVEGTSTDNKGEDIRPVEGTNTDNNEEGDDDDSSSNESDIGEQGNEHENREALAYLEKLRNSVVRRSTLRYVMKGSYDWVRSFRLSNLYVFRVISEWLTDLADGYLVNEERTREWNPESQRRMLWDVFVLCAIMYSVTMFPFRVTVGAYVWWYIMDYFFDVVLLIDAICNWTIFSTVHNGILIVDAGEIRELYNGDRFAMDLFSIPPWDMIVLIFLSMPSSSRTHHNLIVLRALCRLPKLMWLFRGTYYVTQLNRLLNFLGVNELMSHMVQLLIVIFLVGHWAACIFYQFANLNAGKACEPDPNTFDGMNCVYHGTWVEQQIMSYKLPLDGGRPFDRYVRSMNWSIPCLMVVVMADIMAVNEKESLYVLIFMFFGLSVSSYIIGNVISIFSSLDPDTIKLTRNRDNILKYLKRHKMDHQYFVRCANFMAFEISAFGQLSKMQERKFAELPHSLVAATNTATKLPLLRGCPFFDFCNDECLLQLCMMMQFNCYGAGDPIISYGDLGTDMYFLDKGVVEVVSSDGSIVFATLQEGSFFGEQALFFKSTRTATIRAVSVCLCLSLSKSDLDQEIRVREFDMNAISKEFISLQKSNRKRNSAIAKNLLLVHTKGTKLSKIISIDEEAADKSRHWSDVIRLFLSPSHLFGIVWKVIGLLFLLYYAISIPFYVSFMVGSVLHTHRQGYIAIDFMVDVYWALDVILKSYFMPYTNNRDEVITLGSAIWHQYRTKGNFYIDVAASLPLEFFAFIPGLVPITLYLLRVNHMLRMLQLSSYLKELELMISAKFDLQFSYSKVMVSKILLFYVLVNHWMSCINFMIPRYLEFHESMTWTIADGLAVFDETTGHHDVCHNDDFERCYVRSIYYILSTITSVGLGDITAFTTTEIVFQILTCVVGACGIALLAGAFSVVLNDLDADVDSVMKSKMSDVEKFIAYKKLDGKLADSVWSHFDNSWEKDNLMWNDLSTALQQDIAYTIHQQDLNLFPIFRSCTNIIQKRIASKLRTQIKFESDRIYQQGDPGHNIFLVSSGYVYVGLPRKREKGSDLQLDNDGLDNLQVLYQKQAKFGSLYSAGHHFGEFCMTSKLGLRPDYAEIRSGTCELYTLSKIDFWKVLMFLPIDERREFIKQLFTTVGTMEHTKCHLKKLEGDDIISPSDQRLKTLFRMSSQIIDDILEVLSHVQGNETIAQARSSLMRRMSVASVASSTRNFFKSDSPQVGAMIRKVSFSANFVLPSKSSDDEDNQSEESLEDKAKVEESPVRRHTEPEIQAIAEELMGSDSSNEDNDSLPSNLSESVYSIRSDVHSSEYNGLEDDGVSNIYEGCHAVNQRSFAKIRSTKSRSGSLKGRKDSGSSQRDSGSPMGLLSRLSAKVKPKLEVITTDEGLLMEDNNLFADDVYFHCEYDADDDVHNRNFAPLGCVSGDQVYQGDVFLQNSTPINAEGLLQRPSIPSIDHYSPSPQCSPKAIRRSVKIDAFGVNDNTPTTIHASSE